jgi:hypothetical protein
VLSKPTTERPNVSYLLRVTLRGTDKDHIVVSPSLSEEEADEQLGKIAEFHGSGYVVRLPWANFQGATVIAVEKVEDPGSMPRAA